MFTLSLEQLVISDFKAANKLLGHVKRFQGNSKRTPVTIGGATGTSVKRVTKMN